MVNSLYYGDNLDILIRYIADGIVQVIYLDPPFNSDATYNVLFAEKDGTKSTAQIKAFGDTWHWGIEAEKAYAKIVAVGDDVSRVMQGFRLFLGECDMMAYLTMMAPRLIELRRVLKDTGLIFIHCDQNANAYLRVLCDQIFGSDNFLNEIIWYYGPKASQNYPAFQPKHDTILLYSKTSNFAFNFQYQEYAQATLAERDTRFRNEDENGRYRWTTRHTPTGEKYRAKVYMGEGVQMTDVWEIPIINATSKERLGYPTQKPEALLVRIILSSSNEGDIVLDPFCGCGTAISVAQRLGRQWIGIDITCLATNLIKCRLWDAYGADAQYEVISEPVTLSEAEALAAGDKYQFQWWSLGLVKARPSNPKKGADKGIDGRRYFFVDPTAKLPEQIIFSVKGGDVTVKDIRDLRGVIDREEAAIGVFITLQEPTKPMTKEAAIAGFYISPELTENSYPRMQILTIEELLSGKQVECPSIAIGSGDVTFKHAAPAKKKRKAISHRSLVNEQETKEDFE